MSNSHSGGAALNAAVAAIQSGRFDDAVSRCEAIVASAGVVAEVRAEARQLQGIALMRMGRAPEAVAALEAALTIHPQRHAVLSNLGNALRAAGRLHEAAAAQREAVRLAPAFVNGWYNLGIALKELGEPDEAAGAFAQAVSLSPRAAAALNNLGTLRLDAGDAEGAVDLFSRALASSPELLSARVNRAAASRALGRIKDALDDLARAAAIAPGHPEVLRQTASTHFRAGDEEAAAAGYRRALAVSPGWLALHGDYARLMWAQGGADGGWIAELDKAIAAGPSADLLALRSELMLLAGDFAASRASAERAVDQDPSSARAHAAMGFACRRLGDHATARERYLQAVALAPHDFEIRLDCVEAVLAGGGFEEARGILDARRPTSGSLQRHIGLTAIADRALGATRYSGWYDYDRFVRYDRIRTPEGYADLPAFNAALGAAIRRLHRAERQPLDQTLFGGTQSVGSLWSESDPAIVALVASLRDAAAAYVKSMAGDAGAEGQDFVARRPAEIRPAGSWSVILKSGGGHVDHIHPMGWASACYYVEVPDEVAGMAVADHAGEDGASLSADLHLRPPEGGAAGFLRLGASGVPEVAMAPERWVRPRAGSVVFFPSFMWHGVEPFTSRKERITAPFDLAPALTGR